MAQAICSIEGCDRPIAGRGWCKRHWQRWSRTGDPLGSNAVVDPAPEGMKTCRTCGQVKSLDEFHRNPEGRCGRLARCKACVVIETKARYWAEPDKYRAAVKASADANREDHRARRRAAYAANPASYREYASRWANLHPEARRKRERERYRKDPRVRARIIARAAEQRARAAGVPFGPGLVDRQLVFERDAGVCGICGQSVDPADWHLDHIVPLSHGGPHSYENVQVSHPFCNTSKGNRKAA